MVSMKVHESLHLLPLELAMASQSPSVHSIAYWMCILCSRISCSKTHVLSGSCAKSLELESSHASMYLQCSPSSYWSFENSSQSSYYHDNWLDLMFSVVIVDLLWEQSDWRMMFDLLLNTCYMDSWIHLYSHMNRELSLTMEIQDSSYRHFAVCSLSYSCHSRESSAVWRLELTWIEPFFPLILACLHSDYYCSCCRLCHQFSTVMKQDSRSQLRS